MLMNVILYINRVVGVNKCFYMLSIVGRVKKSMENEILNKEK